MKRIFTALSLLAAIVFSAPAAHSEEAPAKTVPSRWSLDQWLKQKQQNRLMDQWLALHESSPYEFYLSADGTSIAVTNDVTVPAQQTVNNAIRARVGAYASIVGLEATYQNLPDLNSSSTDGAFHVRLLGTSVRSTNFDAYYSIKYRQEFAESVRVQGPGARLTILLIKTFGISGSYEIFREAASDTGQKWSSTQTEAEAFIDFERLRIFGRYTKCDDSVVTSLGATEKRLREGVGGGLKVFF